MVKSIVTLIIAALIFAAGGVYEQAYLKNTFSDFSKKLENVYEKTENETVTESDVKAVQDVWINYKKSLHVFISHNDIKEFDMWIAESLNYVKQKNYGEALDKLEVAIELSQQIPKGYMIKFENIF